MVVEDLQLKVEEEKKFNDLVLKSTKLQELIWETLYPYHLYRLMQLLHDVGEITVEWKGNELPSAKKVLENIKQKNPDSVSSIEDAHTYCSDFSTLLGKFIDSRDEGKLKEEMENMTPSLNDFVETKLPNIPVISFDIETDEYTVLKGSKLDGTSLMEKWRSFKDGLAVTEEQGSSV